MAALKVVLLDAWSKPFGSEGHTESSGFPPDCKHFARGGFCGECVYQPFLPIFTVGTFSVTQC